MPTPIKRIEKDFYLKMLFDQQIPVHYFTNRTSYILHVERPVKHEIFFKADRRLDGIKLEKKIDLMFEFLGNPILFTIEVKDLQLDQYVTADTPRYLYRNLERSYLRTSLANLKAIFTFREDRFALHYPKHHEYISGGFAQEMGRHFDLNNLQGVVDQIASWIEKYTKEYEIVVFEKERPPKIIEERVMAENGKILYLPSVSAGFPETDPQKRYITRTIFRRYLETIGTDPSKLDESIRNFLKRKNDLGLQTDVWIPILFQEYVLGYIHIWAKKAEKPFDDTMLDNVYQLAKLLAYAFKINGYFNSGLIPNLPFEGKVVDISVSGLQFSLPTSERTAILVPNSELSIIITVPEGKITTAARVVRSGGNKAISYFGCRFFEMPPEDIQFFFQYLYGKPPTDEEVRFLAGHV
ncbi:MAG: PilZ domain-containing protein [Treponema sp.]|jgi:hypothetical protein|nr:PilZ domain-containing protein [Treponema sp.]